MKVVGVIPARMGATRFPGKPLAPIAGRPMVEWVVRGALSSQRINEVVVATDDERIVKALIPLGVRVVMTDSHIPSGSDRVWQAIGQEDWDIVVNIQGDEPLISGKILDPLVMILRNESHISMATSASALTIEELSSMDIVKVLVNQFSDAIYFSRFPIPYSRLAPDPTSLEGIFKHTGIYAYRSDFLKSYCSMEPVAIERAEALEQLRALHMGAKIRVVPTDQICCGVDTPEDVKKIERLLESR
jgi:3-deoxy-manno-octulosonate cytidylyltransferase (CMP-KDO synthetase)